MNDQDSDDGWSFLISGDSNDCNGESESNAAEGMADFFGSNHFSEESEDNPGFGDAVGSNGDVNVDSLDINSGDAMGDLLGLTANTDDQHSDGNPATRCDNVVSRGRGRPKGSRGNKLLRKKIHEKQEEARVQEEACQPQPGTIEYARMCKADIKKQKTIADSQQALCDTSDVTPCRMLATTSPVWQVWTRIGSHLQKMIALSAKETILNQRLAEDFLSREDVGNCLGKNMFPPVREEESNCIIEVMYFTILKRKLKKSCNTFAESGEHLQVFPQSRFTAHGLQPVQLPHFVLMVPLLQPSAAKSFKEGEVHLIFD